ncbi:MAG: formate dehydrogenase, partial [Bradyrhizobium sp.]|nr:formate dehydrogenase [Bradyrhizobium sp.]
MNLSRRELFAGSALGAVAAALPPVPAVAPAAPNLFIGTGGDG